MSVCVCIATYDIYTSILFIYHAQLETEGNVVAKSRTAGDRNYTYFYMCAYIYIYIYIYIYKVQSKSFRIDFFKNLRHMRKTHTFIFIQNELQWLLCGRTISGNLPKIPIFGSSLIHQLRLLGSQQHPQRGVLLTSFSTWGTENSLAEINLESTGVTKVVTFFGVKNWQTFAGLWAGALSCKKKKFSTEKRSWTNPLSALQEVIQYSFLKFCIYCFPLWNKFFVHYALRVEKIINMVLMRDLWNFSFFGWWDVSPTHSELCRFVSGSQAKHQVSSPVIILLKQFLSASAIAIMPWQDVTRSSLCSGVKECGRKRAHNLLFPISSFRIRRTTVLGMFRDSAIILDTIRRSFWPNQQQQQCLPQFESILDGHLSRHFLPAPFCLEIENT